MKRVLTILAGGLLLGFVGACEPGPGEDGSANPVAETAATNQTSSADAAQRIEIEGEQPLSGSAGQPKFRGNASGGRTWLLELGQAANYPFSIAAEGSFTIVVHYSNDDTGHLDQVKIAVDGVARGAFTTSDTGNGGNGWNVFVDSPQVVLNELHAGSHVLTLTVSKSDGWGVEIDRISLVPPI